MAALKLFSVFFIHLILMEYYFSNYKFSSSVRIRGWDDGDIAREVLGDSIR